MMTRDRAEEQSMQTKIWSTGQQAREHRMICSGCAFLPGGLRLDITPFPDLSVVSTSAGETLAGPEEADLALPWQYRPWLNDFLTLLNSLDTGIAPKTQAYQSGRSSSFSLKPLEADVPLDFIPIRGFFPMQGFQGDEVSRSFRMAGVLAQPFAKAMRLLRPPNIPLRKDWLPLRDVFGLMTQENAQWTKNLKLAINLTSPDHAPRSPIVDSLRFQTAAQAIYKSFLKSTCNGVLLKGAAGVGKSCLIEKLAQDFLHMHVPSRLQGHLMVGLNIELFMPSHSTQEDMEKTMLRMQMAARRTIWVIDEASRLVDKYGNTECLDTLLLFLDQGARVILLSDQSFLLEKREAFMRRLNSVYLAPANDTEATEIATHLSHSLTLGSGIAIQHDTVEAAVRCSRMLPFAQPHAVTSLIANAFAAGELRGARVLAAADVEREVGGALSQGAVSPTLPGTDKEFAAWLRKEEFVGHEAFLKVFWDRLSRILAHRYSAGRGGGVVWACMLIGACGIGKTTFLKLVGKMITGTERKIYEVNCASYQAEHAIQSLIGSPMSYVGYGENGTLQRHIKQHPDGVVIFKKPESGHVKLQNLIADILDGTFVAGDGQILSTRNLFVFLTGMGPGSTVKSRIGFGRRETDTAQDVRRWLEQRLEANLLLRIGWSNVFSLSPLTTAESFDVIQLALHRYERSRGVKVLFRDGVSETILAHEAIRSDNVRGILNLFHSFLEPLFDAEIANRLATGGNSEDTLTVFVDQDGKIRAAMSYGGGSGRETDDDR